MESLKVALISNNSAISFSVTDFTSQRLFNSKDEIHCVNWNSKFLKKLHANLVIILPELDICQATYATKKIRETSDITPIIAIRKESSIDQKEALYLAGVDDYISIPYESKELKYRIQILLRRSKQLKADIPKLLNVADINFDLNNYIIQFDFGHSIRLTPRQSELLYFFLLHPNSILERNEILNWVWGKESYFLGRSMDVIISSIRKVLKHSEIITLETIHGKGFILHTTRNKSKYEKKYI